MKYFVLNILTQIPECDTFLCSINCFKVFPLSSLPRYTFVLKSCDNFNSAIIKLDLTRFNPTTSITYPVGDSFIFFFFHFVCRSCNFVIWYSIHKLYFIPLLPTCLLSLYHLLYIFYLSLHLLFLNGININELSLHNWWGHFSVSNRFTCFLY